MSHHSINGRWDVWRPRLGQVSTDAVANWEARANAKVEWVSTLSRRPDNTAVHTVTPTLTCFKCHPLADDRGVTLSYPYSDPSQAKLLCDRVMDDWRREHHGQYELIEYSPRVGGSGSSYTLSIMVYYKLKQCVITDCEGQGPSLKAAKSAAAQKLLSSGHCMICL